MYGIENKLLEQLLKLKTKYSLKGVKAEFEAEGSSFRDLVRLRRMTAKIGVKLFLKIGGVEAIRDIKDSLEIGVDGLIAPMVETKFGVKKFLQAYERIYKGTRIHLALNVETKNAVSHIDDILECAKGRVDSITVGRTDLSDSYFHDNITPDSKFITKLLEGLGEKIRHHGLEATIGGSISKNSIKIFRQHKKIPLLFDKIETRKIILPTKVMLNEPPAIGETLKFEELYILSKKEITDLFMESEIARLTKLERRL